MPRNAVAYDDDFFAWTQEQARLLRDRELSDVDADNLAEEIESVGKSDRREIRSRLTVLLAHLLKWQFQPEQRSANWSSTLRHQRDRIGLVIEDSPSLKPVVGEALATAFRKGRLDAAEETRLPLSVLPAECPYTVEQILNEDFLPEE